MQMSEMLKVTGLSEKAVRLYEEKGLIKPKRSYNGRRQFSAVDLEILTFLAQSRRLGFPLQDCVRLLELRQNQNRRSSEVKQIAEHFLAELAQKRVEIEAVIEVLENLVSQCPGDDNPSCAIIDALTQREGPDRDAH